MGKAVENEIAFTADGFIFSPALRRLTVWVQTRSGYPFHRNGANGGFLARFRPSRSCLFPPLA